MSFADKADDGFGEVYNRIVKEGYLRLSMTMMYSGKIPFAIGLPNSMMYPFAVCEKMGCEIRPLNQIYYTKGLLGVTSFGKEKDTAKKFVELALSVPVQESDLGDGLPVNQKAAVAWQNRDSNITMGMGDPNSSDSLYAEYPDLEKRTGFMSMLGELKTPVSVDDVLLEMMIHETNGFFKGTQTVDQAAHAVENKAKLYYAE